MIGHFTRSFIRSSNIFIDTYRLSMVPIMLAASDGIGTQIVIQLSVRAGLHKLLGLLGAE